MKATFHTEQYRFSHGKAPRGTGRWMFEFSDRPDSTRFTTVFGTYTEAKKKLVKYLRWEGIKYASITVLP
jgi:hypothetical protein